MRQYRPFTPYTPPSPPEPPVPPSWRQGLPLRLGRLYGRARPAWLFLAAAALVASSLAVYDHTRPAPQNLTQRDIDAAVERTLAALPPKPSLAADVYEVIRPSVVRIEVAAAKAAGEPGGGIGAGVVVDEAGHILTNLHVVSGATAIRVIFADRSESAATVVVAQPENDLAVLQPEIIPDDLQPATLAGSGALRVGDEVVAVGHPFGIANSVTSGVVSGFGRSFKSRRSGVTLNNLIQFDAAVNPGNSGGPLLNRDGEVVGIVTALLNPTDEDVFIGIGFAVTMETAGGALGSPGY